MDRETAAWLDAGRSDPLEPPCTIELRDPAGLTTETWVGAWLRGALARKGYPPAGVALGAEYELQKSESDSFACLSADQPMHVRNRVQDAGPSTKAHWIVHVDLVREN
ncbi:hypothetical protein JCM8202_001528 [Rhodotorula sphaerocarpa]